MCVCVFPCVYICMYVTVQNVCLYAHLLMEQDQKEAVEKGLVTMQDVEMAVAQGNCFCMLCDRNLMFWTT